MEPVDNTDRNIAQGDIQSTLSGRKRKIIPEDPISYPDVYLADTNHILPEEPCPGQGKKKIYLNVVWIQNSTGSSLKSKPDSQIHWRKHKLLPEKPRRGGSASAQLPTWL